ncbi:MAG TPA: hypothetical protein VGO47_00975 [Chlamydiales bacterium]|nr:hypothetical protein [Chlamydiales bacterium]
MYGSLGKVIETRTVKSLETTHVEILPCRKYSGQDFELLLLQYQRHTHTVEVTSKNTEDILMQYLLIPEGKCQPDIQGKFSGSLEDKPTFVHDSFIAVVNEIIVHSRGVSCMSLLNLGKSRCHLILKDLCRIIVFRR